jgi:hypothetical protein
VPPEEPLQGAVAKPVTARPQGLAQFFDRGIRDLSNELTDQPSLRLDPARAAVTAKRAGPDIALCPYSNRLPLR